MAWQERRTPEPSGEDMRGAGRIFTRGERAKRRIARMNSDNTTDKNASMSQYGNNLQCVNF